MPSDGTATASGSDVVSRTEATLAALIALFDIDEFNSCLQQLLSNVVRYNLYLYQWYLVVDK